MASIWWKLVVSPLNAPTEVREVVVSADNWLAALRAARRELGEEGGVPQGASCVMSGGGVTILDASSRRRFVLSRTNAQPETSSKQSAEARAPEQAAPAQPTQASGSQSGTHAPIQPVSPAQSTIRKGTMAYSPEESAAIRAQLSSAQKQEVVVGTPPATRDKPSVRELKPVEPISPKVEPPPSAPSPAESAPVRKGTMAYSPEESAAIRAQLGMAQKPEVVVGVPAPQPASAPEPAKPAAPAHSGARKGTMAYSPEESAEIRAQLVAAQKREVAVSGPAANDARKASTGSENAGKSSASGLEILASRDAEPTQSSPLIYRERSFYARSGTDEASARTALTAELLALQAALAGRGRGILVSLALFDHAFQGQPQRAPIATLEWKDWRGEPVFTWTGAAPAPVAPSKPTPAPMQPVAVAKPTAPVAPAPSAPSPSSPGAGDSWMREATGEQDRRLATAFEAVQDLYFLASAADGLDFAVKLLSELISCEAASGCLYDINTDELRFVAATGPGAEARRAKAVRSTAGLLGNAAHATADVVRIVDVAAEPRFDPDVDSREGLTARNMLFFPLHLNETMLGVLQLINRERRNFTDADVAVGTYVAKQVAEFLQSKRTAVRRPR